MHSMTIKLSIKLLIEPMELKRSNIEILTYFNILSMFRVINAGYLRCFSNHFWCAD